MSWGHGNDPGDAPERDPDGTPENYIPLQPRQPSHWQPGPHQTGAPPWSQPGRRSDWQHHWPHDRRRNRMFARFVGSLVVLVLLVAGASAVASHLWTSSHQAWANSPDNVWPPFGVIILVPILLVWIGRRIFRSWAVPLADIMDAAEEVATGNLQVQIKERGSREFQRLATSFNRMTAELARTDQQRRNLTADVAHELRTPLHIIQGNLEGILDGVYAPTPEHIEATLQETRTLARLVDDLRTLSLAESGQLPLHPEAVDVHDLLADVATSFSPLAESAGIDLHVAADGTLPMTVYGDPGRLDQVLSNLVNNALRHTPAGGRITLGALPLPLSPTQKADGDQVQITVTDTGEGIAADDLPFIFDRFWRGDRARTHQEGTGSGLGLAITGQLVKAHGGKISVNSTLGHGTTFTLTLPAHAPEDAVKTVMV